MFHDGTLVALNTWTFSPRCDGPNPGVPHRLHPSPDLPERQPVDPTELSDRSPSGRRTSFASTRTATRIQRTGDTLFMTFGDRMREYRDHRAWSLGGFGSGCSLQPRTSQQRRERSQGTY
ncbi:hypothetical protein [Kribbella caucasensis]|uniref:hypothetical protein n=1 Tax=Kribbella caucasensis TaxID=2512215 RepID=UPI00192D7932